MWKSFSVKFYKQLAYFIQALMPELKWYPRRKCWRCTQCKGISDGSCWKEEESENPHPEDSEIQAA